MKLLKVFPAIILLLLFPACEKENTTPEGEERITIETNYFKLTFIEPCHRLLLKEYFTKDGIRQLDLNYDTSQKDTSIVLNQKLYTYTKNNLIESETIYTSTGYFVSKDFYLNVLDEFGNLIQSEEDTYNPILRAEYKYDAGQNLIESREYYYDNGYLVDCKYHYNESGNMILKEKLRPADSSLMETITLEYNADNILKKVYAQSVESETPWIITEYHHNAQNFIIEEVTTQNYYSGSGNFTRRSLSKLYQRDDIGRPLEFKQEGEVLYYSYEYSSDDFYPLKSIKGRFYDNYLFSFSIK